MTKLLILLIRVYQWTLSPLLGPCCRFHPSCSRYALACLEHHGALKGVWLTLTRLSRCHPFHPGGYDPPPLPAGKQPAGTPSEGASNHWLASASAPAVHSRL
jgi:uncharacterized protein